VAERPCLEQLTCQALSDETVWDQELDACWTQAVMSVSVSDRVRRFCPDYALAWFECGYALSIDECEHVFSMWADPVIDRLAACEAHAGLHRVSSMREERLRQPLTGAASTTGVLALLVALASAAGCGGDGGRPADPAPFPVPGCESIDPTACDVRTTPCQMRLFAMAACLRGDQRASCRR
jgi:hypothetical protein